MLSRGIIMKSIITIIAIVLISSTLYAQPSPNVFQAYTSIGINDVDGSTKLLGSPTGGDLVQLIFAGADGVANEPDNDGNPTVDDVLMGATHIGYGFPDPADWDQGKFSTAFNNPELFVPGNKVYIRAFNAAASAQGVAFGNSTIYTILNAESESHDFGEFSTLDGEIVPVEMALFSVSAAQDRILVQWTTATETENAGFHIFRNESKEGERTQITGKLINGAINSQSQKKYEFKDSNFEENVTYYYWIASVSLDGEMQFYGPQSVEVKSVPKTYSLDQNYPNPFNPTTTINFGLKDDGYVLLNIYNIRGQLVRQLADGEKLAGHFSVEWDGRNSSGNIMPSGTYLYTIKVNNFSYTRKMAFMK